MTYLGFDVFDNLCPDKESLQKRVEQYTLSRYAAQYWADHLRGNAESELQSEICRAFISLGKRESMGQIQIYTNSGGGYFRGSIGNSLLHIIAANGLETICRLLLRGRFEEKYKYLYSMFSVLTEAVEP